MVRKEKRVEEGSSNREGQGKETKETSDYLMGGIVV